MAIGLALKITFFRDAKQKAWYQLQCNNVQSYGLLGICLQLLLSVALLGN